MYRFKKEFSEVAIARCSGAGAELKNCLRELADLIGGVSLYIKPTDTVFIKPNLTAGMPSETGGTTDVLFAEAVVELIKEAGAARIIVGECSGNESRSIESLTNLGYKDMCERQGIEMVDLDFAEFIEIPVPNPRHKDTLLLPKIFWECDKYVSVPVLKTHITAGITVAIKNSFGLVTDQTKLDAHRNRTVEKVIADIASVKPADLVFVDGRLGSEGIAGGNDFEHPIRANLVLAGNDPVAIDAVSARLMMQNTRIKYIQWAAEQGAGNDRLDFILIRGLSIDEAKVNYMSPAEQIMGSSNGKIKICESGACSLCRTSIEGPLSRFTHNPVSLLESVEAVGGPGEWDAPEQVNPRTLLLGDCVMAKYRSMGKFVGGCPVDMNEYMKVLADFNIVCVKCAQAVNSVIESIDGAREGGGAQENDRAAKSLNSGENTNTVENQVAAENKSAVENRDDAESRGAAVNRGDAENVSTLKYVYTEEEKATLRAILPDVRILASNKTVYQGANNKAAMDDYLFAAGKCLSGYIRNHGRRVHKYSDIDVTEYAVYKDGCPINGDDVLEGLRELAKKIKAKSG